MREESEIASLIQEFVKKSIVHGTSESSLRANRAARRLAELYRKIRARGDQGLAEFALLFGHEHPSVRLWAASYGLERFPEVAKPVLEELANGASGAVCASAFLTLKVWKANEMKFP